VVSWLTVFLLEAGEINQLSSLSTLAVCPEFHPDTGRPRTQAASESGRQGQGGERREGEETEPRRRQDCWGQQRKASGSAL
jgi:hypothetical protein